MSRTGPPASRVALLLVTAAAGCGPARPARIAAPPLDPVAVAAATGDPDSLPGVAFGRSVLDVDKDRRVSPAELIAWLEEVRDSRVAITSLAVQVRHKGKPLAGATVRLVPESCMGDAIKEATGTTDKAGTSMVTIAGGEYPGVNCGLYRVEISGTGNDGKPLTAEHHGQSTLGLAVGGVLPENGLAVFELE